MCAPALAPSNDVRTWLDHYGNAWSTGDGAAAAALFTDGAVYWWGPFQRLVGGEAIRRRWEEATADQGRVRFEWDLLGRDGYRYFVHWRTTIESDSEPAIELDGAFVLDFDPGGRCRQLQEWWLVRPVPAAP